MDSVLLLSRIQFAIHIGFHFIYPALSIGLSLMIVIMEGLYMKTKNLKYKLMTQFWIRIFAITFALGVATGLVQVFAFGTNWARYSRFVGDVFGSALAAEGIFAFFLEAGFIGVMLFGWDRVRPSVHYFSTIMVAIGAHFSAAWIIAVNSWMQTPAGYKIVGVGKEARAIVTNFWEMVFNHSTIDRLIHVMIGCWLVGAFFLISVAAFYYLKKKHIPIATSMMCIGLWISCILLLAQLVSGDSSARIVAKYQPVKFAAFEGVYKTRPYTPISVWGWVDSEKEELVSWKIPSGLSLLIHNNSETPVKGLDQFSREDWPNVAAVFQFYHLMVIMWALLCFIALIGFILFYSKKLEKVRWFLWILVLSVVIPPLTLQLGWFATEMGRQPWVVYNVLRTAEGLSEGVSPGQVQGSMAMFVCVYILLFCLFIFLVDRKIKLGPEEGVVEEYRPLPIKERGERSNA